MTDVTSPLVERVGEGVLGEAEHLLVGEVVDVGAQVRDDLRGDVRAMLLDVGHPLVRRVRLALADDIGRQPAGVQARAALASATVALRRSAGLSAGSANPTRIGACPRGVCTRRSTP